MPKIMGMALAPDRLHGRDAVADARHDLVQRRDARHPREQQHRERDARPPGPLPRGLPRVQVVDEDDQRGQGQDRPADRGGTGPERPAERPVREFRALGAEP